MQQFTEEEVPEIKTGKALPPPDLQKTMAELIFYIGDEEKRLVQRAIPEVLSIIKVLITQNEEEACEAMEMFDEMVECEVAILVPHIKSVVDFSLEVAANTNLDDAVRVKAMSFLASLTRLKKKSILKHKLVTPLLNVLFPIMCAGSEEDEDDEDDDVESQKPSHYAAQVLDTMALHLPPEKLIPNLMSMVEPSLVSETPGSRRAAFIAMAVVVEGCADYITNKYLQVVLQVVCKGLSDPEHTVRNAALFALGQFSEHLQPDISKFASELLPLLFQYLGRATEEAEKNPKGITKSYYALEMFCENLDKDILPFLPTLMEHLLTVIRTSPVTRPKELAISAIGAAANAAKENMKPYFPEIINQFKVYLVVASADDENMRKLQMQAIDTLGVIARTVGSETFLPLAKECLQLGLNLLETAEDPDLRRCVYGLFAAISCLLKSEMSEHLAAIVRYMITSLKSTEGVKTHLKDESEQVTVFNEEDFEEDVDLTEAEDEQENDNIEGISVENAYMEEKEDTCTSLGELALNTEVAFLPHLEESYQEVLPLMDYPNSGIKKGAVSALGNFCCCVHKAHTLSPSKQTEGALSSMLTVVVPKFLEIIKQDEDRELVMATVDTLHELLQKIGQMVLTITGATDAILTRMKEIFTHQTACQDQEDTEEEDDPQAEFDGMLIESAGDVLPIMAKLVGGQNFLPFFNIFLVDLLKRLKHTSSTSEKSFAVGTLGETLQACGSFASNFVETLYPVFMKFIKDVEEDDEVRSNAVFSLGVLAENSPEKLLPQFPEIMKCLFAIMNKEVENAHLVDNICAATCRLVSVNKVVVPLEHVLPVIIRCLPLKEDFDENPTVFKCLLQLYGSEDPCVMKYLPQLVSVTAGVLGTEQANKETQALLVEFIKNVNTKYPDQYQQIRSVLAADLVSKLDTCMTTLNGSV
ncbi:hypothetical protein ScPMuIL_000205 [Solemya velum]